MENNLDDVGRCGLLDEAVSPSLGQRDRNKLNFRISEIAGDVELDDHFERVVVHPTSGLETLKNVARFVDVAAVLIIFVFVVKL